MPLSERTSGTSTDALLGLGQPPPLVELEAELTSALEQAQHPGIVDTFSRFNLVRHREAVGVGDVVIEGTRYRPAHGEHGEAALIVECVEKFQLVDLIACTLKRRHTATRVGRASLLGWHWLTRAIAYNERLILHSDVLKWMHRGMVGAVVLDWRRAAAQFVHVSKMLCDCEELAITLYNATSVLGVAPEIYFVRRDHA